MTGMIVMKIPAKSLAISTIGAQWKALRSRMPRGVIREEGERDQESFANRVLQFDRRPQHVEDDSRPPGAG